MAVVCIAALGGCTSVHAPKADVTASAAATSPAGSSTWTELHPPASPPARDDASMAYDPATGTVLLFGGFGHQTGSIGYEDDTWSWDGTTWTRLSPAASPPARYNASMAYDAATRTVLLFGGLGDSSEGDQGRLSDTWSWNGTTWTKLSPPDSPGGFSPFISGSMAYDPATGTVLLFRGGFGQTWSWNGTTWTRLSPPASPPGSNMSSMAYDPATGTVLLLLIDNGGSGQTWSWDGTTWTRLAPPASPPVSGGWPMAYDPATATVVLFGGRGSSHVSTGAASASRALGDTWSWNGATWTKLSTARSPQPGIGTSMAYDQATKAMLLFDDGFEGFGPNQTWTLKDRMP